MKLIRKIGWLVIILIAAIGFIYPIYDWASSPESETTYFDLYWFVVPLSATQVSDVNETEVLGELRQVNGYWLKTELNDPYVSFKDDQNGYVISSLRWKDHSKNITHEYVYREYIMGYSHEMKYFYRTNDYETSPFYRTEDTWRSDLKFFKAGFGTEILSYSIIYAMIGAFFSFLIIETIIRIWFAKNKVNNIRRD